jgi:uncharacterized protein YndB with AHSA1/START domain
MAEIPVKQSPDLVEADIHIAAPPERVFAAITDPQQVSQWWGKADTYRVTKWQGDLRVGGKWRSDGAAADGTPFHVSGEYLEIVPPTLLVHTWVASWTQELKTVVRFELKAENDGTHVTLRHSGFAGHPEAKNHAQGWIRVLAWMQAFVEKGETIDSRG